jgi:hypothetical protein
MVPHFIRTPLASRQQGLHGVKYALTPAGVKAY